MLLKRQIPILIVFLVGIFTLFGWFVQSYKISLISLAGNNPKESFYKLLDKTHTTLEKVGDLQSDSHFKAVYQNTTIDDFNKFIILLNKSELIDTITFSNFTIKRNISRKSDFSEILNNLDSKKIMLNLSVDEKNRIASFVNDDSTQWYDIIASFAIFLGALNLLKMQVQKFRTRKKNWQYSGLAIAGFLFAVIAGFFVKGKNEVIIFDYKEQQINELSQIISDNSKIEVNDIKQNLTLSLPDEKYTIKENYIFESSAVVLIDKINGLGIKNKIYPEWGTHLKIEGTIFKWMFKYIFTPLGATMFALLAFFVASASYRAFRIRNFEATLLLIAGIIIMLGRVPIGHKISAWFIAYLLVFISSIFINTFFKNKQITFFVFIIGLIGITFGGFHMGWPNDKPAFLFLPTVQEWIYLYPNVAGARAIMIGIALGMVGTSVRIILGIEKSFMGE